MITKDLNFAAKKIKEGELVAFPTETFFGLAADPTSNKSVSTLLELKDRNLSDGVPLIISSEANIKDFIKESSEVEKCREEILEKFWPGPLTIVFSLNDKGCDYFQHGVFGPENSLAVRVSSSITANALSAASGGFITSTSANLHGRPPAKTAEQVLDYFPNLTILDAEEKSNSTEPSTILDVRKLPFKILRQGSVSLMEFSF